MSGLSKVRIQQSALISAQGARLEAIASWRRGVSALSTSAKRQFKLYKAYAVPLELPLWLRPGLPSSNNFNRGIA